MVLCHGHDDSYRHLLQPIPVPLRSSRIYYCSLTIAVVLTDHTCIVLHLLSRDRPPKTSSIPRSADRISEKTSAAFPPLRLLITQFQRQRLPTHPSYQHILIDPSPSPSPSLSLSSRSTCSSKRRGPGRWNIRVAGASRPSSAIGHACRPCNVLGNCAVPEASASTKSLLCLRPGGHGTVVTDFGAARLQLKRTRLHTTWGRVFLDLSLETGTVCLRAAVIIATSE